MTTVRKSDVIDEVAAKTGLPRKAVADVAEAMLAAIREKVEAGTAVSFKGFGRFEMRERGARRGRNPATGDAIEIAASRHLAFKASKP